MGTDPVPTKDFRRRGDVVSRAGTAVEPPADAWVMGHDGHVWVTDGALAIRSDAPRPASMRDGVQLWSWRHDPRVLWLVRDMELACPGPTSGAWPARVLPVLQAGVLCGPLWYGTFGGVWRGGELIALVSPRRGDSVERVAVVDGVADGLLLRCKMGVDAV
jgi:hypothetical protein